MADKKKSVADILAAARKADAKGSLVAVERRGNVAEATLDAIEPDSRFLNDAVTELTLIDPALTTRKLEMPQTAPGRYAATFAIERAGSYQLMITQKKNGVLIAQQSRGLAVGYPDELRLRAPDRALLRMVADLTGGRFDTTPEAVFAPSSRAVARATPLWPGLVVAAALFFVADVALRRIDLTLFFRPRRMGSRLPERGI
jgi:hypothetical protein